MSHTEDFRSGDQSKEDINTITFLELLLRYGYVCPTDFEEDLKVNLPEEQKRQFLEKCEELLHLDEAEALKKLKCIKKLYSEECVRLQEDSNNENETKLPWFYLAGKLFKTTSKSATARTTISQPLQQITNSLFSMPNKISPKKLKKHSRSISMGDSVVDNIASKTVKYDPNKSKSLPCLYSSQQMPSNRTFISPTTGTSTPLTTISSPVKIFLQVKTPYLCLLPPMKDHTEVPSSNYSFDNAPGSSGNSGTISVTNTDLTSASSLGVNSKASTSAAKPVTITSVSQSEIDSSITERVSLKRAASNFETCISAFKRIYPLNKRAALPDETSVSTKDRVSSNTEELTAERSTINERAYSPSILNTYLFSIGSIYYYKPNERYPILFIERSDGSPNLRVDGLPTEIFSLTNTDFTSPTSLGFNSRASTSPAARVSTLPILNTSPSPAKTVQ